MSKWYPVGLPIRDFVDQFTPGMVLEVEAENGPQLKLVGDYNIEGGTCGGCCSLTYDTDIVIRYRMINWRKP